MPPQQMPVSKLSIETLPNPPALSQQPDCRRLPVWAAAGVWRTGQGVARLPAAHIHGRRLPSLAHATNPSSAPRDSTERHVVWDRRDGSRDNGIRVPAHRIESFTPWAPAKLPKVIIRLMGAFGTSNFYMECSPAINYNNCHAYR